MGAAPRYWGRSEPCRLTVPSAGRFHTASGSILNATTTPRSAFHSSRRPGNSGAFSFSGCARGRPCWTATSLTALAFSERPRPAGLSGAVTTPTTWCRLKSNCSRQAAANCGVPRNTIRRDREEGWSREGGMWHKGQVHAPSFKEGCPSAPGRMRRARTAPTIIPRKYTQSARQMTSMGCGQTNVSQ